MRTTTAYHSHENQNEADHHHVVWELDGGGAHRHHEVVLFEGRLYSHPVRLVMAKFRSKAKRASRAIAGFVPFLFV